MCVDDIACVIHLVNQVLNQHMQINGAFSIVYGVIILCDLENLLKAPNLCSPWELCLKLILFGINLQLCCNIFYFCCFVAFIVSQFILNDTL